MQIKDIIYKEEILVSEVDENLSFTRLSTDINNVDEDTILIIPSTHRLPDTISNTVAPLVTICDVNAILPEFFPTIRVEHPRLAMSNAYYRFSQIDTKNMKIIGITGTNGKSSTATFIKTILSKLGHKVGFIGTGLIEIAGRKICEENYSMTTPDPALLFSSLKKMEEEKCDVVVMEVSSHALALDKVTPLRFDYAIFTNLSPEHTDFHSSMEEYYRAKSKLFNMCNIAIFNIDDAYGRRAYTECHKRKISAGIIWRGDVWATNIENNGFDGIGYIFHEKNFSFKMSLKVAGIYNAYNSMLAAAVCIDMGCKPCEVKQILGEISGIDGRFEIINDEITVIIDYAHTNAAFSNIMKELNSLKGNKKLTLVFGCGGERDRAKRPKMAAIAERYADKIIVTTDNSRNEDPKDIISDIIRGFEKKSYRINENREEAIRRAIFEAERGEVLAIIGKGCEKYNIDKDGYHHYDEKAVIRSALEYRRVMR